jgi:hypothetical protein
MRMFRHYFSAFLWPNRGSFAGLVVACLLGTAPKAGAQAAPTSGLIIGELGKGITPNPPIIMHCGPYVRKGPEATIYIDGKRKTNAALTKLNPDDIADIKVIKHGFGSLLKPARKQAGALVITTKAGQNTQAVHRFRKRMAKLAASAANATPVVD